MTNVTATRIASVVAMTLFLTFGFLLGAAGAASAAETDAASAQATLAGTWKVQVTLRDCTSGAPLGPAVNSLVTFHRGGTISETASSLAFAPGQRSPGHGTWAPGTGHTYQQEMIALVLFSSEPNLPGTPTFDPARPVSPGFQAGWLTVSHTLRLTDVDRIESIGTNRFFNTSGESYRSGCSTAIGHRF